MHPAALIAIVAVSVADGPHALLLVLGYGGRAEIVDAMNALLTQRNGNGHGERITEEQLARHLYTEGLPDPDLLIRTSGEMRVSDLPALARVFAYAEMFVTDTLWPDFNRARLCWKPWRQPETRASRYGGIRESSAPVPVSACNEFLPAHYRHCSPPPPLTIFYSMPA